MVQAIIQFKINDKLFLRDPQGTELGQKILKHSIELIDEIGFEQFTFKKLATNIKTGEASIYRYFENKHRLLLYLITWYWRWLEYQLEYQTNNIDDASRRLEIALNIITMEIKYDPTFAFIDESALHRIVIAESDKTYLTKHVDDDNKEGFFRGYKSMCTRMANIIKAINPEYPYAHSAVSMIMEAAHQQVFFSQHLPALTDVKHDEFYRDKIRTMLTEMTFKLIG